MKTLTVIMLIILSVITVSILPCYSNDNVINACYQKKNGQLRIVAKPTDCLPSEVLISWNVQGPSQGPGYVRESVKTGIIGSNDVIEHSVQCYGENDYVTGCSYSLNSYEESRSYYSFLKVLPDNCVGTDNICQGCRVVLYNSASVPLSVDFSAFAYCSAAP